MINKIVLLFFLFFNITLLSQKHVATWGSNTDSTLGTIENPFATVTYALSKITSSTPVSDRIIKVEA